MLGLAPAAHAALVTRGAWRPVAVLLGIGWATLYVWPVWRMIVPGEPLAASSFDATRRTWELPAGATERATVLVRAPSLLEDAGSGEKSVAYRIRATAGDGRSAWLTGELVRREARNPRARGPGGGATVVQAARLHTLDVAAGAGLRFHLVELRPGEGVRLELSVLPGAVPWRWLWWAFGLVFVLSLVVDARAATAAAPTLLPHAGGVALVFAVLVRDALDPAFPVKPLFFTAFGAAVAGVVAASALAFLARRLLRGKREPCA